MYLLNDYIHTHTRNEHRTMHICVLVLAAPRFTVQYRFIFRSTKIKGSDCPVTARGILFLLNAHGECTELLCAAQKTIGGERPHSHYIDRCACECVRNLTFKGTSDLWFAAFVDIAIRFHTLQFFIFRCTTPGKGIAALWIIRFLQVLPSAHNQCRNSDRSVFIYIFFFFNHHNSQTANDSLIQSTV